MGNRTTVGSISFALQKDPDFPPSTLFASKKKEGGIAAGEKNPPNKKQANRKISRSGASIQIYMKPLLNFMFLSNGRLLHTTGKR